MVRVRIGRQPRLLYKILRAQDYFHDQFLEAFSRVEQCHGNLRVRRLHRTRDADHSGGRIETNILVSVALSKPLRLQPNAYLASLPEFFCVCRE